MSAFPDSEIAVPIARPAGLTPVQFAASAATLAVLGLSVIWPTVLSFWSLWTTDALKSIGIVVPFVSFVLILRVWRTLGWRAEGTWWGLAILLLTVVVVRIQQQGMLLLVLSPAWSTPLPPPSLILLAYGSGIVLLFGGTRLYRAALFPILLLWFANPVPHVFSLWVDLPLQHASATIARAFAHSLGQPLTPDGLRLMFTPDFGMFIAPGCNGIRGSVTMGFIALIAGYVYRFRWYATALVAAGAVLLGYLFNLVRLCLLVIYYVVALHFPSLQNKAKNADYLIGASLFLVAAFLLFTVIYRLRDSRQSNPSQAPIAPEPTPLHAPAPRTLYAQLIAVALIACLGCADLARAYASPHTIAETSPHFPQHLGNYTFVRSWNETIVTGATAYIWAQYVPAGGGTPIAIGVSPILGWHEPFMCHTTRGEKSLWQGQLKLATAGPTPIDFSSAFYNDGATQFLEASTQCTGGACGEFATERTHFGFIYTRPETKSLFHQAPRVIPVLLRVETIDMATPADAERQQMIADLRTFLASVNLDDLTRPYGQ